MTPECRSLCFASSVVGLLCYAFSSSFNHLFGKWSLLKIFLYIVFSFIICLAVLFAMLRQHQQDRQHQHRQHQQDRQREPSLSLQAHLAILVLIITSAYSFYFDKVVNGKPDAYSLISSAAFAIMSLGLSSPSYFGFEVDLLYFFLGSVIVQLMKIKLWLFFVGAGFTYFLVNRRSFLNSPRESENLESANLGPQPDSRPANTASPLRIMPPQASAPIMTFDASSENGGLGLQDQGHVFTQADSHSQQANTDSDPRPKLRACIEALEEKNRELIGVLSNHVHMKEYLQVTGTDKQQRQIDDKLVIDALPSEIINNLHDAVKLMVAAGFEEECRRDYSRFRTKFLDEFLSRFGLQRLNIMGVHEEGNIERWIKASNIALRILFPNERKLCDRVFSGLSSNAGLSFIEVCEGLTFELLYFAEDVAFRTYFPKFLGRSLRVLKTLLDDLIPQFEALFYEDSKSLWNAAHKTSKELGDAIRGFFMGLENRILRDAEQATVRLGAIHPITYEVMGCLRDVTFDGLRDTLEQVLQEYPRVADGEGTSSRSGQIARIVELLESNLEASSKIYKGHALGHALGHVFMMNNLTYIKKAAESYGLVTILGDDWIQKNAAKVQQYLENYQRSSWNEVLGILDLDSNESVEDRLSLFDILFEQICSIQSSWFFFDEDLREKIIHFLKKNLLPAYGYLLGRFQHVRGANNYKYGLLQVETLLNKLFSGSDSS